MENSIFATRVDSLKASAIREILKVTGQPGVISFAGGIPSPTLFPKAELAKIAGDILVNQGNVALNYGVTEGYKPLADIVKGRMDKAGVGRESDRFIITSGGQQAIDLAAKVLIEDGSGVICEEPSFIGSLNSFRSYNARLFGVPMEADGLDIDRVEKLLQDPANKIRLIYVIPTFQNPSGITTSLAKRRQLLALAEKYDAYILEDNPYGELRFSGEEIPAIKTMDETGRVIYVGSFSKILSPGLRVGWAVGRDDIIDKMIVVKQVNDVHTPQLTQMIAAEFLRQYSIDEHIEKARRLYGSQCRYMLECMDQYFPRDCTYTRPNGGLFIFVTLREGADTNKLLAKSLEKKVAFVPGNAFMVDIDKPTNTFRLNYSTMDDKRIHEGIQLLAEILK